MPSDCFNINGFGSNATTRPLAASRETTGVPNRHWRRAGVKDFMGSTRPVGHVEEACLSGSATRATHDPVPVAIV